MLGVRGRNWKNVVRSIPGLSNSKCRNKFGVSAAVSGITSDGKDITFQRHVKECQMPTSRKAGGLINK
jgi:hypothetical protein